MIHHEKKPSAVYRRLSESLRDTIARHAWPVDTQLPNIKKIAAEAGVSLRTADLAVQELVKCGICYRRPKQGTFVAHRISDSDGRKRVILMHSSFSCRDFAGSSIQTGYLDGLQRLCAARGVTMIPIYGELATQLEFYRHSNEVLLLGVVFTDPLVVEEKSAVLRRYPQLRFALINYRTALAGRFGNLAEVYSDEAGGGAWTADYLWARGHRRIGIINLATGSPDQNYQHRVAGFRRRFNELGGQDSGLCYYLAEADELGQTPSQRLLQSGAAILQRMLRRRDDFTAIFCVEDAVAAGAAASPGGQRFEVVGFDRAIPCIADMAHIASLAVDYSGMAYRAGELLLATEWATRPEVLPVRPVLPGQIDDGTESKNYNGQEIKERT